MNHEEYNKCVRYECNILYTFFIGTRLGGIPMGKKLVAYYEIMPKQPYSKADLNWMDKKSRSSVEMSDKKFRPEISNPDAQVEKYDEIILGFPIWWYIAPTIINTFLEKYDFSGKKIVLFATSGGSGFGNTVSELKPSAPDAEIVEGKVLNKATKQEIAEWIKSIS